EIFSIAEKNEESCEKIDDAMKYLINYVVEHFGAEESFMITSGYQHFEKHRQQHTYFIMEVYKLYQKFVKQDISEEFIIELQVLIIEWLVTHINEEDKLLAVRK
ncbi:MAG: hemerythrin family protein, partial [Bacillota bacterium]|nr:hemerythrin family protein [Bacillota bacterium]